MSAQEQQEEELEVLRSIYDGDNCFKEVNGTTFQYKVGEDQDSKSFLLEVSWGDSYPEEMPNVGLDAFYNKHIAPEVKADIVDKLIEQGDMLLGCAMTYTLFEYAKENAEDLMTNQPDTYSQTTDVSCEAATVTADNLTDPSKPKQKKEQLTKSQKRKMYSRLDTKGEHLRGWNWMDVIKHLSQTGRGEEASTNS